MGGANRAAIALGGFGQEIVGGVGVVEVWEICRGVCGGEATWDEEGVLAVDS